MNLNIRDIKELVQELIKLLLIASLAISFMGVVFVVLYGIMFVTQPMSGQSPNDKALFAILTPLAIFLPTVLNQIWQGLNNDKSAPPPPAPAPMPPSQPENKKEEGDGQAT